MGVLLFALLMLAAVLVSSVIDQLVPKVSSPLIQIGLGLIIGLVADGQIDIIFEEPDLFLLLFIAPLLYYEAKCVDRTALWKNRIPVLSLAVGLVIVTMLCIGFAVHWLIPSIGLAAAFALGAALGPTDAVAVTSLSRETSIPDRLKSILGGELLINDASGIVSFQFALTAAVTGMFSPIEATATFLIEFVGGIAVGLALGTLANYTTRKVRSLGLENTTFHVLFEVLLPFIVYLIANEIHTSGILAVVAAGLVSVISPKAIGPSISRLNVVSSSVWSTISFALNGIVFVLLGTQLPRAMQSTWENVTISNYVLIGYILLITFILLGVRFLWTLGMEYVHKHDEANKQAGIAKEKVKLTTAEILSASVMTLAGPKGTITLAVILTMPRIVPQQQLIVFLACGVIVVTLMLATFVVPLLAPKKPSEDAEHRSVVEINLEILRHVIEELSARQTPENRAATQMVIRSYNERIARIKDRNSIEDKPNIGLRTKVLHWERAYVDSLIESGDVDPWVALRYLNHLSHIESLLHHHTKNWSLQRSLLHLRTATRASIYRFTKGISLLPSVTERSHAYHDLQISACEHAIEQLQTEVVENTLEEKTEDVSTILMEYQRTLRTLRANTPSITVITTTADKAVDVERLGLHLELEDIQARYEEGELDRAAAKLLRENIYLMQINLEDHV